MTTTDTQLDGQSAADELPSIEVDNVSASYRVRVDAPD